MRLATVMFSAVLAGSCARPVDRGPSSSRDQVQGELAIFSGRMPLTWRIDRRELDQLRARLRALPATATPAVFPPPHTVTFVVANRGGVDGIPRRLRVTSGLVEIRDAGAPTYFIDVHGLAAWLNGSATSAGAWDRAIR